MAEEVSTGGDSGSAPPDVTDEEYECKICYNYFDLDRHAPKLLGCSHTFCHRCLDALHSQEGGEWRLVCRQRTPLPEHRVDKLPDNSALTDSLSLKKPESADPSNAEVQACPAASQESDDSCQTCRQVAFVTGCAFAILSFLSTAVLLFLGLIFVHNLSHAAWPVGPICLFVASVLALLSLILTWLMCMLKYRPVTEERNVTTSLTDNMM